VTRILVAAESPVVRAGLEALVEGEPDFTVVGRSASHAIATLAQEIDELEPDVILLELAPHDDELSATLPALLGIPAGGGGGRPSVVLLADAPSPALVASALRAGARAVLPREATGEEIIAATRSAAVGLASVPAGMLDELLRAPEAPVARNHERAATGEELTARELDVLRMLGEGLGNKQIAARLAISDHTVKFHVASIFQKLHASTRTEAVTIGIRRGVLLL
jgi:NarL family two-component system response regulator YdfI